MESDLRIASVLMKLIIYIIYDCHYNVFDMISIKGVGAITQNTYVALCSVSLLFTVVFSSSQSSLRQNA
jgi:formate hydrogenlyase subunit 3/multisubunit Na+/H+ antiporter MnhD subunit